MLVRDILDVQNNNMANMDKAKLITKMLKARAKRHNPKDADTPIGWCSSPYGGSPFSRAGGSMPA